METPLTFPTIAKNHLCPSREAVWFLGGQLTAVVSLRLLTLVYGVWRVDDEQREVSGAETIKWCVWGRRSAGLTGRMSG